VSAPVVGREPVVDPELGADAVKLLRAHPSELSPYTPNPEPEPDAARPYPPSAFAGGPGGLVFPFGRKGRWPILTGVGLVCLDAITHPHGLALAWLSQVVPTWLAWAFFISAPLALVGRAAEDRAKARELREAREVISALRGRYILPQRDLGEREQPLLARARVAVRTVTRSPMCQGGVLDAAMNESTLNAELWEVAKTLADAAIERRRLESASRGGDAQAVRALLAPRHTALNATYTGIESRVTAVEVYARQVQTMEAEYRTLRAAEAAADRGSALDLASGRVNDQAAIDRIRDLGEALAAPRAQIEAQRRALADTAETLDAVLSGETET
jgi:hypothetical protein